MIPKVEFEVSRVVNEFCHISVLYSELMPPELAQGILGNKAYQAGNGHLRRDEVRLLLQRVGPFSSESEWYVFARGLMKRDWSGDFESLSGSTKLSETFGKILQGELAMFEEIWRETRSRLDEYKEKFSSQWHPISDKVLSRLSQLAKTPWMADKIHVHFIDCLFGGFGWNECIGFAAFPIMEVQKKFIAHELAELITPQHIVGESLRAAGLHQGIAHTVVDMLAYFSVRDFLEKPVFPNTEKKGIKPNPNYYPRVDELFPIFERYAENPSTYPDFKNFVQAMIRELGKSEAQEDNLVSRV